MKISTKIRYGLRAMIDLGMFQNAGPVLVKSIADRQQISKKYLDNLLMGLKSAGLVRSIRGAKGGYVLAKPMEKITVEDILIALEGPPAFVDCVKDPTCCRRSDGCVAFEFWSQVSETIEELLRKTTIAELVVKQKKMLEQKAVMYYL